MKTPNPRFWELFLLKHVTWHTTHIRLMMMIVNCLHHEWWLIDRLILPWILPDPRFIHSSYLLNPFDPVDRYSFKMKIRVRLNLFSAHTDHVSFVNWKLFPLKKLWTAHSRTTHKTCTITKKRQHSNMAQLFPSLNEQLPVFCASFWKSSRETDTTYRHAPSIICYKKHLCLKLHLTGSGDIDKQIHTTRRS